MAEQSTKFTPTALCVVGNEGVNVEIVARLARNMLLRHGFIPYVISRQAINSIADLTGYAADSRHKLLARMLDAARKDGANQFVIHSLERPLFEKLCKLMGAIDPQHFHVVLVENEDTTGATFHPYKADQLKELVGDACVTVIDTRKTSHMEITRHLDAIPKRKFELEYRQEINWYALLAMAAVALAITYYFWN